MVQISADSAQRRGFEAPVVPCGLGKLLGVGELHGGVVVWDEVLFILGRVQKCNKKFSCTFFEENGGYGNGGSPRSLRNNHAAA